MLHSRRCRRAWSVAIVLVTVDVSTAWVECCAGRTILSVVGVRESRGCDMQVGEGTAVWDGCGRGCCISYVSRVPLWREQRKECFCMLATRPASDGRFQIV